MNDWEFVFKNGLDSSFSYLLHSGSCFPVVWTKMARNNLSEVDLVIGWSTPSSARIKSLVCKSVWCSACWNQKRCFVFRLACTLM